MNKRKSFKILLISGILIILGVFVIFNYSQILKWWEANFEGVEAGTSDNVRGWAWGENMGWISMNCYNDFDYDYVFENCCLGGNIEDCTNAAICQGGDNNGQACSTDVDCLGSTCSGVAGGDYGVTYVDVSLGNYIDDALMGYAWSDKVGWICFGKSCKCADCTSCDNYNTCTICSGCPNNVKPPHGWPFPWACVGKPTWTCDGGSNNGDSCSIATTDCDGSPCIFSCSGDGGEDFLDITVPTAPCYSTNRATLKAHWEMNALNGIIAEALVDSSVYGNTLSGSNFPILANGKINDALQFDGDAYIQADDSASLSITKVCLGGGGHNEICVSNDDCPGGGICIDNNLNLTVEAWVKRGTIGTEQTIIGKWDEALDGKSYRLWFDANNRLNFSVADDSNEAKIMQLDGLCFGYDNDGSDSCSSDADCIEHGDGVSCRNPLIIDTMKWHHVAGKYMASSNAPSLQLFIDGLKVNTEFSGSTPVSLSDKDNKLYIGAKMGSLGIDTYFNGIIDNVAIWSCGGSAGFISGRSAKDIWSDAKMEVSGWAKVVALGDGGWLKLQGSTIAGKVWGLYLDDYDTFYTIGGYMANRYADTSMDTDGLIANWLMDEPSWTNSVGQSIENAVADSGPSGNNDGTAKNGATPSTEGKFNSAGEFDGVDDYIEVLDPDDASLDFNASDDFTIQFFAKPNSFSNNSTIVVKRQGSIAGYEVGITSAGYISWYISDGTINEESSVGTDALTLNAWNHVAVVFDRDSESPTITRYLNGLPTVPVDDFGSVDDLSNDLSLSIGARHLDSTAYFKGLIDNVSVYNVARTATQILADYNKQDPYCVGWDDYDHEYGDPPAPFDFEISEIDNTQGCEQLFVSWESSTWAESYTYERCDGVEESQCLTCPDGYDERNVLSGACEYGQCSLQDAELINANTGYCYKIQAHNETGSTYNSNDPIPVWKQTTLCFPENVEISDDTCGEIQSMWELSLNADGYNIYRSLNNDSNGCNYSLTANGCELIGHLGEAMDYDLDNDGADDLVAQWKMNETSWNGTSGEVRDSSGQILTNHGTAYGCAPSADGLFNNAGSFDGTDDYIDCGSNESLEGTTATIQAWVKRASVDSRDVIISDNKTSEADEDHFLRWEIGADDRLAVIFGDETYPSVTKYSTGLIDDTNWHHVAVVRDDSVKTITFYVDGEEENEQSYFNELNTICSGGNNPGDLCDIDDGCDEGICVGVITSLGDDNLWIGQSNENDKGPFDGLIDNLAIYNSAKTAEQIKLDYDAGNCGSDDCGLTTVCHIEGVADGNCNQGTADPSVCCYTDKRILSYVDYYYRLTATSEAGESPASNCDWTGSNNCPIIGDDPCCPNGRTICFPPVETEER